MFQDHLEIQMLQALQVLPKKIKIIVSCIITYCWSIISVTSIITRWSW